MLDTYIVTADRIYDDYRVEITNYWDGDSWEFDFTIYWDNNPPPDNAVPIILDPEEVKYVGQLYMPDDPNGLILRTVWESVPTRIGNVLGVTREYEMGYARTVYIGGDGEYYYFSTSGGQYQWMVEQSDGSWATSQGGPPAVFVD